MKNKPNLAYICSYISLVLSIVMLVLWGCNVGGFSVVNLDTFVGVIVALLAIIVTFVLGWQIINALEIKRKLAEIETIKASISKQERMMTDNNHKAQHLITYTFAANSYSDKEYAEAYRYGIHSLLSSMSLDKPLNIDLLLRLLEDSVSNMPNGLNVNKELYDHVLKCDREIRELKDYSYIKRDYESYFSMYIRKATRDDSI